MTNSYQKVLKGNPSDEAVFFIPNSKQMFKGVCNGVTIPVNDWQFGIGEKFVEPKLNKNFAKLKRMRILLEDENEKYKEIKLPDGMVDRFLQLLKKGWKERPDFDCSCFAYHMHGVYGHDKTLRADKWMMTPINKNILLDPGDLLSVCEHVEGNSFKLVHMSIYLGHGLCLSKGGTGPFFVATVGNTQKLYRGSLSMVFLKSKHSKKMCEKLVKFYKREKGAIRWKLEMMKLQEPENVW